MLVLYNSLDRARGKCLIDLSVVDAITPLLGAPIPPRGESIDMGDIRVIGCRVDAPEWTVSVDACPIRLARQVSFVQGRLMLPADIINARH